MEKRRQLTLEEELAHSAQKKGLTGADERRYVGGAITNMRKRGKLPARSAKPKTAKKPEAEKPKATAGQKAVYLGSEKRYNYLHNKIAYFGQGTEEERAEYKHIAPYWRARQEARINADPHYYEVVTYKKTRNGLGKPKKMVHSFKVRADADDYAKRQREYVPLLYEKVEVVERLKDWAKKKGKK